MSWPHVSPFFTLTFAEDEMFFKPSSLSSDILPHMHIAVCIPTHPTNYPRHKPYTRHTPYHPPHYKLHMYTMHHTHTTWNDSVSYLTENGQCSKSHIFCINHIHQPGFARFFLFCHCSQHRGHNNGMWSGSWGHFSGIIVLHDQPHHLDSRTNDLVQILQTHPCSSPPRGLTSWRALFLKYYLFFY